MSEFNQILKQLEQIQALLDALSVRPNSTNKPFISLAEASEYLGIPKQTLYSYTSKGIIPFHKLNGRRIYFAIEDLNEFILNKQNRRKSQSEIEQIAANRMLVEK